MNFWGLPSDPQLPRDLWQYDSPQTGMSMCPPIQVEDILRICYELCLDKQYELNSY
jgi:hypothetical protein